MQLEEPPRDKTLWEKRARIALDRWGPAGSEESVADELQRAYRDGMRHAASVAEKGGHSELGMELRKLADLV